MSKEGEGMIMDCDLHTALHILERIETRCKKQKDLYLENVKDFKIVNECMNRLILNEMPKL